MKSKIISIILLLTIVLILLCPVSSSDHLSDLFLELYNENESILTMNSVNISIDKPNGFLYIFNTPVALLPPMIPLKSIIIGSVTVSVSVDSETVDNVEFFVDDQLVYHTSVAPYEWTWHDSSRYLSMHQLKVIAYSGDNVGVQQILVLYFNPFTHIINR